MGRAHSSLWSSSPKTIPGATCPHIQNLLTGRHWKSWRPKLLPSPKVPCYSILWSWFSSQPQRTEGTKSKKQPGGDQMLQLHTVYKNTLRGKKERRGWKEGHHKITAGLPAQPKGLSSLLTCWLAPTKQMLAKLLGIPGSSIIIWWQFQADQRWRESGIGGRPPEKEKRKRLPFIQVKKEIEGSQVHLV